VWQRFVERIDRDGEGQRERLRDTGAVIGSIELSFAHDRVVARKDNSSSQTSSDALDRRLNTRRRRIVERIVTEMRRNQTAQGQVVRTATIALRVRVHETRSAASVRVE
jgi:hypothetical protein